jgi:RUN domain
VNNKDKKKERNTNAAVSCQLNETLPAAVELCTVIEICLLHGIKLKEFHGVVPLWGLLERLETMQSSVSINTAPSNAQSVQSSAAASPSVTNSGSAGAPSGAQVLWQAVGAVARMSSLRTPLARARGWIRQVLNAR